MTLATLEAANKEHEVSGHAGPEYTAPDDQRCEALVRGQPGWNWAWVKVNHRCPKTANQMRAGIAVCHLHAKAKTVEKFRAEMVKDKP